VLPYIFHILNIFNITDKQSIFSGEKKYLKLSSKGRTYKEENGNSKYMFNLTELLIGSLAVGLLLIKIYYFEK
jgi:hypothetical protein